MDQGSVAWRELKILHYMKARFRNPYLEAGELNGSTVGQTGRPPGCRTVVDAQPVGELVLVIELRVCRDDLRVHVHIQPLVLAFFAPCTRKHDCCERTNHRQVELDHI